MKNIEKYREFLASIVDLNHPNKKLCESVLSAYNIIFEADTGIAVADTDQADQLSTWLKKSNFSKEDQIKIYSKFVEIDLNNIYPHQTLSLIFSNLKQKLLRDSAEDIIEYLAKYS